MCQVAEGQFKLAVLCALDSQLQPVGGYSVYLQKLSGKLPQRPLGNGKFYAKIKGSEHRPSPDTG